MKRFVLVGMMSVFSAMSFVQAAEQAKEAQAAKPVNPVVTISTSKGDILVELDAEKAPISVANFLAYTQDGFYNGTIFHRVIKDFMVQGGGMTADMKKKPTKAPIKNEAANGLKNKRGTIAMARTNVPNSATSQFFINHKDNAFLDFRDPSPRGIGYAVFGKVLKGMDVVDAIAAGATRKPGDVPVETVTIKSVTVMAAQSACTKDCDKCPKQGECSKEEAKCEKACDKKAACTKDCDKCPKKGTKDCPKENGTCCGKKAKDAKPAEKKAACGADGKCSK